jgi:GNAT superfamily N-acetyltransferase
MPQALNWRVEHACFNAWPSLRHATQGDWLLRSSDGLSRRANSVNALNANATLDDDGLANFHAIYRAQSLPLIVRVPTLLPHVDELLDRAGFVAEGESCVLHGALTEDNTRSNANVMITTQPDDRWFTVMIDLQGYVPKQAEIYRRVIAMIALPAGFATLYVDGEVAAVAYGVIDRGLLCCESVIVSPSHRGRGLGGSLMRALFDWARVNGATAACLQVVADNSAGRALYRGFGLTTELHRYHYRRLPSQMVQG